MSRIAPTPSPIDLPEDDPFRYGWRYVRRVGADGEVDFDQIPLTLEDVLHPEEEDFIVNSTAHDSDTVYLRDVLRSRRRRWRKGVVVLHDCRVSWGVRGLRAHGPDITVLRRVKNPDRDWRTFHVGKEGARPVLAVEVTSPDTRVNDVGKKVNHYHRAGVRQYVIVDASERDDVRTLKLIGYRHTPRKYVVMEPDELGRLPLLGLGLLLGVRGPRVVLYDAETGEELGDYDAISEALETERAARQAAEEARQALEEDLGEVVEARNAAEQGRRAAEEQAAAEAKARKAEVKARKAEVKARKAAEKELARLRARLAVLQKRQTHAGTSVLDASAEE